ncbi:tRNA preQ1(34) S-adenosylmethionine ribosyltransferase-isomerase QueA [Raoultibacter phocaeensis]|uniref:tRNA preQ1(34) S-adenosylmethionine ribosyltransferase-isomerase QueA n=1 Tax=Raoultibacter phocaeensis TaxID=2479841 RepID=UPI00111B179A|nr:tRNA preQ1(34) S-adenosylmethionine ribosyltransferase-isomerase QueA [Raoultibacter phocaeensis]
MKTSDFDYILPEERIAQAPAAKRDECKLLVMDRNTGAIEDRIFRDIYEYLKPGDLLVANETRVMPARLLGAKRGTGGAAEVFLLRESFGHSASGSDASPKHNGTRSHSASASTNEAPDHRMPSNQTAFWEVLVRPGKRLKPGAIVDFADAAGNVAMSAEIVDWVESAEKGERLVRLVTERYATLDEAMHAVGHTPLPPYIKNYAGDEELYQTVFSKRERSAAAPTAGLHFTPELIERLQEKGVFWETVELEVGLDTFRIVDEDDPEQHRIHTEFYTVPQHVVDAVSATRARGGRVVAVGTTSVRSLESAWDDDAGMLKARNREATSLYILPGYEFHAVDALVTNFHVPRSTLMMLVSAFSTRDNIIAAYEHAVAQKYRMLSFGDAMFIA